MEAEKSLNEEKSLNIPVKISENECDVSITPVKVIASTDNVAKYKEENVKNSISITVVSCNSTNEISSPVVATLIKSSSEDICVKTVSQGIPHQSNLSSSVLTDDGKNDTKQECEPNSSSDISKENILSDTTADDSLINVPDDNSNVLCATLSETPEFPKSRRGRKRKPIYDKNEDPESLKQKRKKRAVELKLKNLSWSLNQSSEVTGKRQKKKPERFELSLGNKRRTSIDCGEGDGDQLGAIPWIVQQVRDASIYTLRLLHRVIFRKQGMFSEKHIKKSVMTFRGFPFDTSSPELRKRRDPLEKANLNGLSNLCDMLGIKCGTKIEMIDRIIQFLHCPSREKVEEFLKEVVYAKLEQQKCAGTFRMPIVVPTFPPKAMMSSNHEEIEDSSSSSSQAEGEDPMRSFVGDVDVTNSAWKKPAFFIEGTGVKLKFMKAIMANIHVATDGFIDLLHRLLFLNTDEKYNMRRNILEFSGFKSVVGSNDYVYRTRLLAALPADQIKFICRALCLPTWHRSRQLLIEGIMDFLAMPRISAMKKRMTPSFEDISIPFDITQRIQSADLKNDETEEIEIVPDIHISEEALINTGRDFLVENNEESEVKLKNFSNIHYQVISTPAAKLNDIHMILYFRPCPLNNVRKNILEFSGFPFNEYTSDYQCRKTLMEQMSVENLKLVANVFCLSQYVVDKTKNNIIQAVLKFLLKPSVLLSSCTIMSYIPPPSKKTKQSSKCGKAFGSLWEYDNENSMNQNDKMPFGYSEGVEEITVQPSIAGCSDNTDLNVTCPPEIGYESPKHSTPKSANLQINSKHVPMIQSTKEQSNVDLDEPLAKVQKKARNTPSSERHLESDEEEDEPLSNLVGHPNDDQVRLLVAKIIKESKLDDITMKQVIRTVFNSYPKFDLGYRKEFIKSIVRQILSQMDEQSCSVSTTVLTI